MVREEQIGIWKFVQNLEIKSTRKMFVYPKQRVELDFQKQGDNLGSKCE